MLSQSIELRATKLIEQGIGVLEAVKLAIRQENAMIQTLFGTGNFLSSKGKIANEITSNKFWNKHHGFNNK